MDRLFESKPVPKPQTIEEWSQGKNWHGTVGGINLKDDTRGWLHDSSKVHYPLHVGTPEASLAITAERKGARYYPVQTDHIAPARGKQFVDSGLLEYDKPASMSREDQAQAMKYHLGDYDPSTHEHILTPTEHGDDVYTDRGANYATASYNSDTDEARHLVRRFPRIKYVNDMEDRGSISEVVDRAHARLYSDYHRDMTLKGSQFSGIDKHIAERGGWVDHPIGTPTSAEKSAEGKKQLRELYQRTNTLFSDHDHSPIGQYPRPKYTLKTDPNTGYAGLEAFKTDVSSWG